MKPGATGKMSLQDQFDAAHRDAKHAGPGIAGILTVGAALGRMGKALEAMMRQKEGVAHD